MSAYVIDAVLGLTLSGAFLVLGAAAFNGWRRRGDRVLGHLALAATSLGIVCVAFRVDDLTDSALLFIGPLVAVGILASGHELLMLRDVVIPFAPRVKVAARLVIAAVAVYVSVIGLPLMFNEGLGARDTAGLLALTLIWGACVVEPMVRFRLRARSLPTVQRARMRALSVGYLGLVVVLVLAGAALGAESEAESLIAEIGILILALLFVLVLGVAFAPPRWIRRIWREREERALLHATGAAMFAADDREVVATRALHWAIRLVGGSDGVFASSDLGTVVSVGLDLQDGIDLVTRLPANGRVRTVRMDGSTAREAMVIPVRLESGVATLIVVAGPFTPPFSSEETVLLAHFGETVAAALDRLRVDEMRTAFLNALSHELRTPLTAVVGFAQTLRRDDLDKLSPERRAGLVDAIVRNGQRLEQMLTDLLDVDRLSRGVLEARRRDTDVIALVRRAVDESTLALGVGHVVLRPNGSLHAQVDPPMFERMIENLLANAVKHAPRSSTIWVTLASADGALLVDVSDEGDGVPQDVREVIFEPFKRGANAPDHSPGSGIGLSLVARFAELHGGRAWVEDRPGGGAAFKILLPDAVQRRPEITTAREPAVHA